MKRKISNYMRISIYAFCTVMVSAVGVYLIFNFEHVSSFMKSVYSILNPIITGFVIAYLLNPAVGFFENKVFKFKKAKRDMSKSKRLLSIISVYLIALLVISALIWIVVPQLFGSVESLINKASQYQDSIDNFSSKLDNYDGIIKTVLNKLIDVIDSLIIRLTNYLTDLVPKAIGLVKSITVAVVNTFIGIIVSIYILSNKEILFAQCKKFFHAFASEKWMNRVSNVLQLADESFGGFIRGTLIDSTLVGLICYIILLIMRTEYALLISVIVGITNIIPVFGPIIGAIPSVLILLVVNPRQVIPFLIVILVMQQIDGHIIIPKILGKSMGLSSFWILVSIVIMSGLFGFAGMIIGVPLFTVFYVLFCKFVNQQLKKKAKLNTKSEIKKEP